MRCMPKPSIRRVFDWIDFEEDLRPFYFGACGFTPTNAGLLSLD